MPRDTVYDDAAGASAGPTDADKVSYSPTVLTDWDGNADPGNIDGALDQLAERVDDNEITLDTAATSSVVITDHAIVRGDGGARGIQDTGIIVADNDHVLMPGTARIFFNNTNAYIYSDAANQITVAAVALTTIGALGSTIIGDGALRQVEPQTDVKINLGQLTKRFNNVWGATLYATDLRLLERSSDPTEPAEGYAVIWMSDGTGKGDDGDVMIASNPDGNTKYGTLFDYNNGDAW